MRQGIIVIADEAHRGPYSLEEKIDLKSGLIMYGSAKLICDNLPNATYIGFTGMPIATKDRSTLEIFGDYIN